MKDLVRKDFATLHTENGDYIYLDNYNPLEMIEKILYDQHIVNTLKSELDRLKDSIKMFESYYVNKDKVDPLIKQITYIEAILGGMVLKNE